MLTGQSSRTNLAGGAAQDARLGSQKRTLRSGTLPRRGSEWQKQMQARAAAATSAGATAAKVAADANPADAGAPPGPGAAGAAPSKLERERRSDWNLTVSVPPPPDPADAAAASAAAMLSGVASAPSPRMQGSPSSPPTFQLSTSPDAFSHEGGGQAAASSAVAPRMPAAAATRPPPWDRQRPLELEDADEYFNESDEDAEMRPDSVFSPIESCGVDGAPGSEIYYFGIIDILQQYNERKILENLVKRMIVRGGEMGISAIAPQKYAKRFLRFIEANVE